MKKQIRFLLAITLTFSLAGCFGPKEDPPAASETVTAGANNATEPGTTKPTTPTEPVSDKTMIAISVPAVTENTTAADGTVIFQYTYQNPSLVLHKPEVADKIILDLINRMDATRADAKSVADAAKPAYNGSAGWMPYLYHIKYSPTRIDHKVLSFSGTNEVYNGGPHPNRTGVSASYDLSTGDVLTLASIMTKDAKVEDFCQLVLEGLSGRAEGDYLYENYAQTVKQRFAIDPNSDEDWYFTSTGLCFDFAPYEIAPYSSGVITVEIPYEKLYGLLYTDYFPAVSAATTGNITVSPFADVDLNKFSHIAELIADNGEKMYMVYTDGQVQDIQITLTHKTVFAANTLSAGEGIMIQASDDMLKNMELSYQSGGETVKMPIIK